MTGDFNNVAASDLVARLRNFPPIPLSMGALARYEVQKINIAAADRIERLEDALRKIARMAEDSSYEIQHIAEEALADDRA